MNTIDGLWEIRFESPDDLPVNPRGGNAFFQKGRISSGGISHSYRGNYTLKKEIILFRMEADLPARESKENGKGSVQHLSLMGRGILDTVGRNIAAELESDELPGLNLIARFHWLCELP